MRNQRIAGILALLASLLLLAPAWAQTEPDLRAEIARRAAERGLTPQQTQAILDHADRVEAADLPVRAVLDRYLEGLARGAPLPRIEAVVDQLETRLRESARHVDLVFPPVQVPATRATRLALIDHCAYALSVRVPPAEIEQAMHLAADGNQGPAEGKAPVLAMGCLVAGGLDPNASLDLVHTAWTNGYRGRDLERLGRELGGLGQTGQGPPPEILRLVRDSIRSGDDRENLLRRLEALRGPDAPGPGQHMPGSRPGEDPSDMRGPGGPPQDPGHQGPGGRHPRRP
jgi:hypothetical protein